MPAFPDLACMEASLFKCVALPLRLTADTAIHYESEGRKDHMLLYLQHGMLSYAQNNQEYMQIRPGDILFLPNGSCYTSRPMGAEGISGKFVRFVLLDEKGQSVSLGDRPEVLLSDASGRFEELFEQLVSYGMHSHSGLKMLSLTAALLDELIMAQTAQAAADSIAPARQYIFSHLQQPISLQKLASLCRMSERTFCRRFQQELGEAPIAYHRRLRIRKAQELLESGMYTVEQTAETMGFVDAAHFSRAFQKQTGRTAGSIRSASFIRSPKRHMETAQKEEFR